MANPIKQVKLNNLEYNPNRDPQVYRSVISKPFDLRVKLEGSGSAQVLLIVAGQSIAEGNVSLPGDFCATPSFDSAGTRVGTITVTKDGEKFVQYVRFDVMEHAWIG